LFQWTAVLALAVGCASAAEPERAIELGAPFNDSAILQRQMPVPVWGWSAPGTKVTVAFGGQKKTAAAGKDGKWMVQLDPLQANATPQEMVIADGAGKTVTLKDILVGEVWMASGQSNMQWVASKCDVGRVLQKQIAERVAAGKEKPPVIREGRVTDVCSAPHPIEHAQGEWSTEQGNFSAISYAFAYELYRELHIPIGILNCSFSTTKIEAWIPRVGFADGKDAYTRSVYQKILETDPATPEHKAAWSRFYQDIEDTLKENAKRIEKGEEPEAISTRTPGNMNGNRDASWMFNAKINPVVPYAVRGAIWNQGYASSGDGILYYDNLHSLVRGWRKVWNRPDLPVYFHQFYCPGQKGDWDNRPAVGGTADMRLGTWLARDIPNVGMASQIDITGAVHYNHKTVPGQRLARHALKNQYGRKIVADGPMFKSYTVEGNKLIVELDHAEGGLLVAETGTNQKDIATPTVVPNGDGKVALFYLADGDHVWHKASMKIDGGTIVLTASGVAKPRGVSYATGGVGPQPNVYNNALLPMTPFILYDHKLVTADTWPDEPIKVHGAAVDPDTVGKLNEYRKMPLLSTQFRDNAVFQAGMPVTIWGSAVHDWGYEAKGKAVIQFRFAGVEKTIPVTPGMREWSVTVPAMEASAEPKTLKVTFTIDGELAHERVSENIVVGDVWYVGAPAMDLAMPKGKPSGGVVRVMRRKAKRSTFRNPSRFSVCVSTTPENRFACTWDDAGDDLAGALGHSIAAKTGKPVGIVFMQSVASKTRPNPELKSWIAARCLEQAPSLMEDYKQLAAVTPGNPYYDANARRYVQAWKTYWSEYVTQMIATKRVPDGAAWGSYPTLAASVTTEASETYNVLVHSFTPASFKGIVFLCSEEMFAKDQGANYGSELSALANCWKARFACEDPYFFYTIPSKALAPKITGPKGIQGKSMACEIGRWPAAERGDKEGLAAAGKQLQELVGRVADEAYK